MIKHALKCWQTLKTIKPQRKDEISLSVMVTKVEKINCMKTRLNPLSFFNGQSAGKPRIEETSTTIHIACKSKQQEYGRKLMAVGEIPLNGSGADLAIGKDIVYSRMKVRGAKARHGVASE